MQPATLAHDLTIYRGRSFAQPFGFAQSRWAYVDIDAVPQTIPVRLAVPGHGVPDGWRVCVYGATGVDGLERELGHTARVVDANTIELNDQVRTAAADYTGGARLRYAVPGDLSGDWSAVFRVRASRADTGALLTLTSEAGGVVIDPAASRVTVQATAEQTANLADTDRECPRVYDLDLTSPAGEVIPLAVGNLYVIG